MILQDIETMTDAEKLALVKAIQENVASSKAKQVSMETGQYAKLVVDAIKKIKTDLEERYAAISADIAVKSAAIKDGVDGINGAKGEKGDTGLRGLDGANGRDGVDGKDGVDGADGVSVTDARIDFDGSLIITLSNGNEINAGEVVSMDVADKIKVIGNGGGTSQYVIDAIDSLQAQIDAVSGGLSYQGTWNASTNTPTLASSTGTSNYYYVVSVSGSTDLNGITDWVTGDWAIYNGTAWQKIDQTNLVTSVAGRTGAVSLSTSDISGLGTIATQNANSVTITGGTATLTSLTTAAVQASNSGGLALKNSAGTTQLSMGAGGGDNLSLNVSTNINGTNAQIDISPTGTGHVHIKPTGVNSIEIAPVSVGDMDNMIIGATTPAAGTFTTLIGGNDVANYGQLTGGATTKAVEFKSLGTDTNVAYAIRSKGTGAIDLAAGSSGVNISNGNTVTALTRTATGTLYTTVPTVAISAPTTAGGVQATATANLSNNVTVPTITSGGTGYTAGDTLTLVGGTFTAVSTLTVSTVSSGVITGITVAVGGVYSVVPTNPMSVTGGTGSGATFTLNNWGLSATFTITNAGSGYVEQPTVTFSGGGGSGAAAYASVGSGSIIRSLGSTGTQSLSFYVPSGEILRLRDTGSPGTYVLLNTTATGANVIAQGSTNATWGFNSNGTGQIDFGTNGNTGNTQLRVSHTASAVNYVNVTGGIAGTPGTVTISGQGSSANIDVAITPKGTGSVKIGASPLATTNFSIVEVGGVLLFKYGATTIASMSSTGLITSAANIVSNGTP
jgi:hypothetical protein